MSVTITATCRHCAWTARQQADDEDEAVRLAVYVRRALLAHVDREHADVTIEPELHD